MKINDRVCYIGPEEKLKGKEGILHNIARGYAGIVFDEQVEDGHSFSGYCDDGHGLYVQVNNIEKILKYKRDEVVRSIMPVNYGITGTVKSIETIGFDDFYTVDVDGNLMAFSEKNIVREEDFVSFPFAINEMVDLNPDHKLQIYEKYGLWFFVRNGVNSLRIKEIRLQQDKTFKIKCFCLDTDESILFDWNSSEPTCVPVVEESVTPLENLSRALLTRKLTFQKPYDFSEEVHCKNGIESLINMLWSYNIEDLQHKQYADLSKENLQMTVLQSDNISNLLEYNDNWELFKHKQYSVIFVPSTAEDTYNSVKEIYEEYDIGIGEIEENRRWILAEGQTVIFYDLFDLKSLFETIMELASKLVGKNVFYELIENNQFEEAIKSFEEYSIAFNKRLEETKRIQFIATSVEKLSKTALNNLEHKELSLKDAINSYEDSLREHYSELRNIQLSIIGLKNGDFCGQSEIKLFVDFLNSMGDRLIKISVNEEREQMTVHLLQEWVYYNEEDYKICNLRKEYSGIDKKVFDMLDDIIINKTAGFLFEEVVNIRRNGSLGCDRGENTAFNVGRGIPNPHHYYYNCWGNHENPINKAFVNGKYTTAISQVIAAVGGVNVADGSVIERFLKSLNELARNRHDYWNNIKCIIDKRTGELFTVRDYINRKIKEED